MGFRAIGHPSYPSRNFYPPAEAVALAPPGYMEADGASTSEMLPRRKAVGWCRLCGETRTLSREHIPPRGAGNKGEPTGYTIDDWLKRETLEHLPGGRRSGGGIWGYTLCRDCNNATGGDYGKEYGRWATLGGEVLAQLPLAEFASGTVPMGVEAGFPDVDPPALVRQVLSMMASLAGDWRLTEREPVLRSIILGRSEEPLPTGWELVMNLYAGPRSRLAGPALVVDGADGGWAWLLEAAFPPLAFLLKIAGPQPIGPGVDLASATAASPGKPRDVRFTCQVGFGYSPYPGDYRSRGEIEAAR
ncbi:MAG TPA: hypothetical protein VM938_14705 [Acidimicrobiales bacterium]|nr:hypothetical protein [Acidimicrobiales bacterium]